MLAHRILKGARQERGQILILFVVLFTLIAIAGAISVDFGLWVSERRGASKDADLVSLAGAYELISDASTATDVQDAVDNWAAGNDIDPVDDVHNLQVKSLAFPSGFDADESYCKNAPDNGGRLNTVVLDVDHESRALFAGIFENLAIAAPEIGAHACARAGSLLSTRGLRPWIVPMFTSECFDRVDDGDGVWEADEDEFIPRFGEDCIFRLETPSSQVGSVRLGADPDDDECSPPGGGASEYRENIEEGADALCTIGDIIGTQPGLDTGPTFAALEDLLSTEGACDQANGNLDGIDQFSESFLPTSGVAGPDVTFSARGCETPRAIHIIIIDEFVNPTGFEDAIIRGFAAFFLQQCEEVDGSGNIVNVFEKCDVPGGARADTQIRGFFMSILELEGDIGDFDTFGTTAIRLVE